MYSIKNLTKEDYKDNKVIVEDWKGKKINI